MITMRAAFHRDFSDDLQISRKVASRTNCAMRLYRGRGIGILLIDRRGFGPSWSSCYGTSRRLLWSHPSEK